MNHAEQVFQPSFQLRAHASQPSFRLRAHARFDTDEELLFGSHDLQAWKILSIDCCIPLGLGRNR